MSRMQQFLNDDRIMSRIPKLLFESLLMLGCKFFMMKIPLILAVLWTVIKNFLNIIGEIINAVLEFISTLLLTLCIGFILLRILYQYGTVQRQLALKEI